MNGVEFFISWLKSGSFINLCMWTALVFYLVCFFPQIKTNYQCKSGKGVSELMLLGYLNAYLFMLYYIFCMRLPFAYRLMVPIHAFACLILVLQRLYYDKTPQAKRFWMLYALNIAFFLVFLPVAFKDPLWLGGIFGWCTFGLSVVNLLPQIFKIYREKSVSGFSLGFILFTGFAAALEATGGFLANLPMQTSVNAVRGLILALILGLQYWIYRNNKTC